MQIARYHVRSIAILIVATIFIFALINTNGKGIRIRRIERFQSCLFTESTAMVSSSLTLDQFDNVNSIPGTTGPGIPNVMRSILSDKYGPVQANASSFYGAEAGRMNSLCRSVSVGYREREREREQCVV